jgi:epoxyqueuosine reductase
MNLHAGTSRGHSLCPGRNAAELYEIRPDFQRFDQKNNITRQGYWNPAAEELDNKRRDSLERLSQSGRAGYRPIDHAYYRGAKANLDNTGFSLNWPNRAGNSWKPFPQSRQFPAVAAGSNPNARVELDPSLATRIIRKMSRQFGADDVGIAFLDRRWVYARWFDEETRQSYPIRFGDEAGYEHYRVPIQLADGTQVIPETMKYAVVLVHEMDEQGISTAPTLTAMATTICTYSEISYTTVMLAEFIRGLGYNAIPCSNDTALSIPLAIDGGLGELGRHTKLIHPLYGPRCRISKVITDLPLEPAFPSPSGVTEFCDTCRKCALGCPCRAIPFGPRSYKPKGIFSHSGVLLWQLDHMKCSEYMASVGTNCGICIRVCPFNKPDKWYHNLARSLVRARIRILDRVLYRLDDLLGYGVPRSTERFWLE